MKKKFITITGMNHYYGMNPFSVEKKIKSSKVICEVVDGFKEKKKKEEMVAGCVEEYERKER